ncbi:unnamed protein product [Pylaiella littoralis]
MKEGGGPIGKKVNALVQEQLQYCRSLRRADNLSAAQQNVATDEECLKQANSLIMLLKADVRALNACAARLLTPSEAETVTPAEAQTSDVARSCYNVETVERLFRRFRQVDTSSARSSGSGSGSGIQAVSATNQLVAIRERLQAGLSARLLELKMEMDKEFGTAFADMESFLRTEKGKQAHEHTNTQAKSDAEHCSTCARYFVELCYKFQARGQITNRVMVHACRGLRAAKEGLNQTVLLKALREERDSLAERLGDCETDLKRIHHSYTEIMNPDMVVGLENRQRHKIEEQEADLTRLKSEMASLKRDHNRVLAENGRLSDASGELQSQLQSNKENYGRELAWLNPKVAAAESRAEEIEGLVDQMNLKLSLLSSSRKKALEDAADLKVQVSQAKASGPGAKLSHLQGEAAEYRATIKKLQGEASRKARLVTVAMTARAEAQSSYEEIKERGTILEQRCRETEGARLLLEKHKHALEDRLEVTGASLASAEAREADTAEELRQTQEKLVDKEDENQIMQERLDDQEMALRDLWKLEKDYAALELRNKDLVYRKATVNGLLEALKEKAIKLGMGRELGIG